VSSSSGSDSPVRLLYSSLMNGVTIERQNTELFI